MAKQTSIEWLVEQFSIIDKNNPYHRFLINNAKNMHKEEITEAFYKGYDLRDEYGWSREHEDADERYYQETYGDDTK